MVIMFLTVLNMISYIKRSHQTQVSISKVCFAVFIARNVLFSSAKGTDNVQSVEENALCLMLLASHPLHDVC